MKKIKYGFTHAGVFHADDVFSAALLTYLFPDIEIKRGFKADNNFDGIVFDIGFGEFDHHQKDGRIRENGVPFAAFGLLWDKLGEDILGEEDSKKFDEDFVQPLDLADNAKEYNILSSIISAFNPTWDSKKSFEAAFEEAKDFALNILKKEFEHILSRQRANKEVERIVNSCDSPIIELPYFIPWKEVVCRTDKLFVVFPSLRGGYNAQAVPINKNSFELKCPFPEDWRGKSSEELFRITAIKDINFCHVGGFLISADNRESVILACNKAMEIFDVEN